MVSSKRLINGSCRPPASLTPLHLARQSAILSCPLPPLCSLLVLLPSQLSLWRPVYSNGCTSASSPHWLPLASVTLSKPCPWGGHKGPARVMNVVPSPCSHSQQCWSQPGFLLVLGDIVPCLCVSCLLHLQLLVFLCLLALLRAHTWALFSPHRPLSLGVLHSHAAPCWLMVP